MSAARSSPPVPLWLRFAAMLYDAVALAGVLFAAAGLVVAAIGGPVGPGEPVFAGYLIAVTYAYFGYCWVAGGQTLGMRTWKIVLLRSDADRYITWRQSLIRFCAALVSWLALGLGFFAAVSDPAGRTWHDRWSGSRLVRL